MTNTVECPHCHEPNTPPPSTIGRYVTCQACGCKFYVYVPPPEERGSAASLSAASLSAAPLSGAQIEAPTPRAESHQHSEGRVLMRQEALLATIHEDLVDLRRRITIACFVFVAGCSAVIATVLLR